MTTMTLYEKLDFLEMDINQLQELIASVVFKSHLIRDRFKDDACQLLLIWFDQHKDVTEYKTDLLPRARSPANWLRAGLQGQLSNIARDLSKYNDLAHDERDENEFSTEENICNAEHHDADSATIARDLLTKLLDQVDNTDKEILEYKSEGLTNTEIASKLSLHRHTIADRWQKIKDIYLQLSEKK